MPTPPAYTIIPIHRIPLAVCVISIIRATSVKVNTSHTDNQGILTRPSKYSRTFSGSYPGENNLEAVCGAILQSLHTHRRINTFLAPPFILTFPFPIRIVRLYRADLSQLTPHPSASDLSYVMQYQKMTRVLREWYLDYFIPGGSHTWGWPWPRRGVGEGPVTSA